MRNLRHVCKSKLANLLGVKMSDIKSYGETIEPNGKMGYANLSVGGLTIKVRVPVKDGYYYGYAGCQEYGDVDKNGFTKVSPQDVQNRYILENSK